MLSVINKYTNKDKERLIKALFKYYDMIIINQENPEVVAVTCVDKYYIRIFKYAFDQLTSTEQETIMFTISDMSEMEILEKGYSRSTYYRIRSHAMSKFLNCLHS